MNNPWLLMGTGMLFCLAGVWLFQRNAFEENKKIVLPAFVIIAGIILICVGTAKRLRLID
jgi:uncharacterized membrane protein AbrB (regulator of aidB expression)